MPFAEFFNTSRRSVHFPPVFIRSFVLAVVTLFAIVHAPNNFILDWFQRFFLILRDAGYLSADAWESIERRKLDIIANTIVPLQTFLFFIAFIVVAYPLWEDIRSYIRHDQHRFRSSATYTSVGIPFIAFIILVIPTQLGQMGINYALMSTGPFKYQDWQLWSYQRILMPFIAFVLQFHGPFLYAVFSVSMTFILILLVRLFFHTRGISLTTVELISIGTSSFIITQFQSPGYTEQLFYILLLILCIVPTSTYGRMSIIALSLLAHEVSILPMLLMALMFFSAKERAMALMIALFYGTFWLLSFGGDYTALLSVRNVNGMSGMEWAVRHPLRLFVGIAVAFKLLWFFIVRDIVKNPETRLFQVGMMLISIVIVFAGVDTSRLMGFGFLSLLIAMVSYKRTVRLESIAYRVIVWINIILPSFYIGTNIDNALGNVGVVFFNGLYQLVYVGVLLR